MEAGTGIFNVLLSSDMIGRGLRFFLHFFAFWITLSSVLLVVERASSLASIFVGGSSCPDGKCVLYRLREAFPNLTSVTAFQDPLPCAGKTPKGPRNASGG